jgi:hypothetical protein
VHHRSRARRSFQGERDEDLEAPEVSAACQVMTPTPFCLFLVSHPRALELSVFSRPTFWGRRSDFRFARPLDFLVAVAAAAILSQTKKYT